MIAFESGEDVLQRSCCYLLHKKYAQLYRRVVNIINNVNNLVNQSVSPLSLTIQYREMKMMRTTARITIGMMMNNLFSLSLSG